MANYKQRIAGLAAYKHRKTRFALAFGDKPAALYGYLNLLLSIDIFME
jgi:hypothetical protein